MSTTGLPLFLVPAFADLSFTSRSAIRSFSTSSCVQARHRTPRKGSRDSNKQRGVSAIRRTGPRHRLSIDHKFPELPRPRRESERPLDDPRFAINENHGLFGFFNEKKQTAISPTEEDAHGRSWTYHELCFKSFQDLHSLYWQCLYEQNRVRTRQVEHMKLKLGYGMVEINERLDTVQGTMSTIQRVLRHRFDAHDEARLLIEKKGWTGIQEELENEKRKKSELESQKEAEPRPEAQADRRSTPLVVDGQHEIGDESTDQPVRRKIGPRPVR